MLDAIDAGFQAAEQDGLPPVGLCVSLLRTQSAVAATELVETLTHLRHPRVVALSVDGNEAAADRTGPRFAEAFRRAGAAGLSEVGVVTVWERPTRVIVTAAFLLCAGLFLDELWATLGAAAWVGLGVVGLAQLLIVVRRRLH
jgi:hypothetical protein